MLGQIARTLIAALISIVASSTVWADIDVGVTVSAAGPLFPKATSTRCYQP